MALESCVLCRAEAADPELQRVEVWRDGLWRLTVSLAAEVRPEAASFGAVLSSVSRALQAATGAELVYVYVFGGGVPHLHVHLAPHVEGDALNEQMIRGPLVERRLPSGLTELVSEASPPLPEARQRAPAARVRELLGA